MISKSMCLNQNTIKLFIIMVTFIMSFSYVNTSYASWKFDKMIEKVEAKLPVAKKQAAILDKMLNSSKHLSKIQKDINRLKKGERFSAEDGYLYRVLEKLDYPLEETLIKRETLFGSGSGWGSIQMLSQNFLIMLSTGQYEGSKNQIFKNEEFLKNNDKVNQLTSTSKKIKEIQKSIHSLAKDKIDLSNESSVSQLERGGDFSLYWDNSKEDIPAYVVYSFLFVDNKNKCLNRRIKHYGSAKETYVDYLKSLFEQMLNTGIECIGGNDVLYDHIDYLDKKVRQRKDLEDLDDLEDLTIDDSKGSNTESKKINVKSSENSKTVKHDSEKIKETTVSKKDTSKRTKISKIKVTSDNQNKKEISNFNHAIQAYNSGTTGKGLWSLRFFQYNEFGNTIQRLYNVLNLDNDEGYLIDELETNPNELRFKYRQKFYNFMQELASIVPDINKQHVNNFSGHEYNTKLFNYFSNKYDSEKAARGVINVIQWLNHIEFIYEKANRFSNDGINHNRAINIYRIVSGYKKADKKLKLLTSNNKSSKPYLKISVKNSTYRELDITYSNNYFVIHTKKYIQIWNLNTKEKIGEKKLNKKTSYIINAFVSNDGNYVLLSNYDYGLFLYDVENNHIEQVISKPIQGAVISPNNKYLGVIYPRRASIQNSFEIIRKKDFVTMKSMPFDNGRTGGILFTEDNQKVFVVISNYIIGYDTKKFKRFIEFEMDRRISEYTQSNLSNISKNNNFLALDTNKATIINLNNNKILYPAQICRNFDFQSMQFINNKLIIGTHRSVNIVNVEKEHCNELVSYSPSQSVIKMRDTIVTDDKILLMSYKEKLGDVVLTFDKINFDKTKY